MLQKNNYKHSLKALFVYFLLSYSFLYFSYKYFVPSIACRDFFDYYPLYKDFSFEGVRTPFNTRLINAALVFLLNKTGLHYTSIISFNAPDIEHNVFFNALVVSYLCIVATCYVIYITCCNYFKDKLFGFLAGLLYLLGGGTYAFCMTPIMDASSGLFMALAFKTFIEKSKWLYFILFLSIFQREYISIVIGTIAFVDYLFEKKGLKQTIFVIVAALLCFSTYIVLRKTFFYTPETVEQEQLQVSQYASRLFNENTNFMEYFRQTLFLQNILFIYVLVLLYKYIKKQTINKKHIVTISILLVQIFIISFVAIVGNNASRVVYMLTPIILFYLSIETYPIYNKYKRSQSIIN